jgi:drug/metabolite transporter (DMT)-like permease
MKIGQSSAWVNYLFLTSIGIIWGSQFVLNAVAIQVIPPLTLAAGRILVGAVTLWGVSYWFPQQRKSAQMQVQSKKLWCTYLLIGIFEAILPFFLVPWGQQFVDSSIAAILMGTIPIFTLLFAVIFKQEFWSLKKLASVLLGFVGVVVLVAPGIHPEHSRAVGELAILGGAISFALSIILLKKLPSASAVVSVRNILLAAAIPMIILSLILDKPWMIHFTLPSVSALLILGSFSAGLVYLMYMILIHRAGPTFASLTNYLVPLVGIVVGIVFMSDVLQLQQAVALVIILAALLVHQIKFRLV